MSNDTLIAVDLAKSVFEIVVSHRPAKGQEHAVARVAVIADQMQRRLSPPHDVDAPARVAAQRSQRASPLHCEACTQWSSPDHRHGFDLHEQLRHGERRHDHVRARWVLTFLELALARGDDG